MVVLPAARSPLCGFYSESDNAPVMFLDGGGIDFMHQHFYSHPCELCANGAIKKDVTEQTVTSRKNNSEPSCVLTPLWIGSALL